MLTRVSIFIEYIRGDLERPTVHLVWGSILCIYRFFRFILLRMMRLAHVDFYSSLSSNRSW